MRKDQELEERFTARGWAILAVEGEGSFDECVVSITIGTRAEAKNILDERQALPKEHDLWLSEYHTLVPIAVDATAWNTDSLIAVPESEEEPFLFPSDALNEIGELLGLEENERGDSGFFDPARVVEAVRALIAPRREPPMLRAIDGGRASER